MYYGDGLSIKLLYDFLKKLLLRKEFALLLYDVVCKAITLSNLK